MIPVIIILLIIGSALIMGSFLFQNTVAEASGKESGTNVERILEDKLLEAKNQLDDVMEKSAGYVKNQTERELEKLSNEKIMAVSEYSEQVIDEINKNHQEVLFLYSMLNDKQKELNGTMEKLGRLKQQKEHQSPIQQVSPQEVKPVIPSKKVKKELKNYSNKEKILLMHQQGLDILDIAKQLNLGIGEVRLVIDLDKASHV